MFGWPRVFPVIAYGMAASCGRRPCLRTTIRVLERIVGLQSGLVKRLQ
jgi:hypothetical protein